VPIFVLAMFISIIDVVLDTSFSSLFGFVGIAAFALSLAVGWRRMQDSGKPGWLILLGFVPCIGAIAVIVLCCLPSQPGANAFGPDPHGA
jgi:uncharacterized membrane protein YhaH (DUF805 family)